MLSEEEFYEMLDDPQGHDIGWTDDEILEFMHVMGDDGWVIVCPT